MESQRATELTEKRRFWQARLEEWKDSGLTRVEYDC